MSDFDYNGKNPKPWVIYDKKVIKAYLKALKALKVKE